VILAIVMGGKLYGVLGIINAVPNVSILIFFIIEIRHNRRNFNPYNRYFTNRGKLL
jgi:putative permease